ncbi:unnamed protein product [Fraxinus pennsylvanica]|uniref:Uncharacterized protein n=1 Tax=Fraxinus pennsylvanica TaxID=56036 RepID=A0AAD2ADN9_9LAMI|nr:unnamed protein product [Fraxinus pennsylvanica]
MPLLVQCLSFGSPDEQLLEATLCLTNIAAGKPEETKALFPALPLLMVIYEEASWAISNIAAGSFEHKKLIRSSEAAPLLLCLLSTAPFEMAYVIRNLCVAPSEGSGARIIDWEAISSHSASLPLLPLLLPQVSQFGPALGIGLD